MKHYDNPVITAFQKMAQQIVDKLEDENSMDLDSMLDVRVNYDKVEGIIKGRNDAIELIKKRFELEDNE